MDSSHIVILLQQHPGAKEKNLDVELFNSWIDQHSHVAQRPLLIVSDLSLEDAQIIADKALYHQTSMAPQLVLAGIPTIHIGHEIVEDMLLRNKLIPSIKNEREWIEVLHKLDQSDEEPVCDAIVQELGIQKNWLCLLEEAVDRALR